MRRKVVLILAIMTFAIVGFAGCGDDNDKKVSLESAYKELATLDSCDMNVKGEISLEAQGMKLATKIDLDGKTNIPDKKAKFKVSVNAAGIFSIGNSFDKFKGQYDGNGYSIFKTDTSSCFLFNSIKDSSIIRLEVSGMSFINKMKNSIIMNCIINTRIAEECKDSKVLKCYLHYPYVGKWYGFFDDCEDTTIKFCIGKKLTNMMFQYKEDFEDQYNESICNKYITKNPDKSKIPKGFKPVLELLVNQDYYENTLDWDFKKVWEWDNIKNKPKLR